jgi:hypothetical protein
MADGGQNVVPAQDWRRFLEQRRCQFGGERLLVIALGRLIRPGYAGARTVRAL